MTYLMTALAVGALLEVAVTWWLLRGLRRLDQVDARIGHLTEALRLLAETTEAGFRASARELSRIAGGEAVDAAATSAREAAPAAAVNRAANRAAARKPLKAEPRVRAAAADRAIDDTRARRRTDATPVQIARPRRKTHRIGAPAAAVEPAVPQPATEEMSESEARLRLLLAERNAADHAAREVGRVALRA